MGKSGEARLRIGQESLHSQLMSTSTRRIPAICISVPVRCNSLKLRGSWLLDNDQHKAHRPYSTLKQECCCPRETYRQKEREREGERAREREEATTIKQQYETKQQSKVEIVGKKIKEIGMKRRRRRIQREKWKKKIIINEPDTMWVHLGACPPWAGDANDATVSIHETILATTVVARITLISIKPNKYDR